MSNGGKIGFSFNSKKTFNKSVLFQEKSSENAQKAIITPSNKALNKAKKQCIEALEHDKNIFQYDEVYDQISQQKALHSEKKDDNKPKYIPNLKKTIEKKNIEKEIIYERVQLKEREKTDFIYENKPVLVTKGYRKVLEERERLKKELEAEDQKNQNEQEKQKKDDFYLNSAKFVENIVNKEEAPVRIIETEYNIAENKKIETEKWEKKFGLPALKEFSEKKDNLTTGRRNTNSDISAAKQRYLERKKAYEAQTTD